jgi:hypothetical protein
MQTQRQAERQWTIFCSGLFRGVLKVEKAKVWERAPAGVIKKKWLKICALIFQMDYLARACGTARMVWNWALSKWT